MATAEALLTAEEYGTMPDDGRRTELVRGRIVEVGQPNFTHGQICGQAAFLLLTFVKEHDLGRVITNDSGIVTHRDPDTVRGADVAYYSFIRLGKEKTPSLYPDVPPDLVIEVRSPGDRWREILAKVTEYLHLGVPVVCVLDPESEAAYLYYPDRPNRTLGPDDEVTFPEFLEGFRVAVRRFFE